MEKLRLETPPAGKSNINADQDDDTFSFAAISAQDPDLCTTSLDPGEISPADTLFSNGLLQPHFFPSQSTNNSPRSSFTISKQSSLTSSNSSGSSSNSSSRRNSRQNSVSIVDSERILVGTTGNTVKKQEPKHARIQPYYGSQRRQSMSPRPVKRVTIVDPKSNEQRKTKKGPETSCFGGKFFKSFMSACRECHALEPSLQVEEGPRKMAIH